MFVIVLITLSIFIFLEIRSRNSLPIDVKFVNASSEEMLNLLANATISDREIDNQFIIHNTALFAKYPLKNDINRAYIGTSRSKMLRPSWYGGVDSINASNNSYNEITYGLLLQAELVRIQFPNLREVFVESSMLLRRPNRLIVENDHKKYLSILKEVVVYSEKTADAPISNETVLKDAEKINWNESLFFKERKNFYFSNFLNVRKDESDKQLLASEQPYIASLSINGERIGPMNFQREPKDQLPAVVESNVKVQRLKDILDWYPWDGLFEIFALWGKANNVQVIFYQPPVRSDLYEYQLKYGMQKHRDDLIEIATKYEIPFIDFNKPELGFSERWDLFADEDHLETCLGVAYYLRGLELGYDDFKRSRSIVNDISIERVAKEASLLLKKCN